MPCCTIGCVDSATIYHNYMLKRKDGFVILRQRIHGVRACRRSLAEYINNVHGTVE